MLTTARRLSRTWVAALIIGLLVIALAIVGTTDAFRMPFSTYVLKAGDREVSQQEFRQIVDNLNARNAEQTGQRFTMAELVESGQHLQLLEGLAGEESLFAWLHRVGLRPARDLIAAQIRQQQAFFDPVTGQFDEETYAAALAQVGLTPARYEVSLRDQIAAEHYVAGVASGMRLPRIYGALEVAYAQETRNGRWVVLDPSSLPTIPAPTEQQLTTLLNEFADRVREPERRVVTIARFTPAQAVAGVSVTEEEIRQRFEFRAQTLGAAETRTFATLTAPNAQVAGQIAQRLRGGETAQAVGQALNIEPVVYTNQPQSAVPDSRVAQAAFGLPAGQVSQPVQGELGLTVIQVQSVTPGQAASLEQHRAEIEQELRLEKARVRVSEMVETFVRAREGGAAFQAAAEQSGGDLVTLPPFAADGTLPNRQPLGAPQALVDTAFETAQGSASDIVDAGNDEYFALNVDTVTPARMPTVEELRPQLVQAWRAREQGRQLRERADALAARVRGGEDIAAVAQAEGLTLVTRTGVGRGDGPTQGPDGQPIAGSVAPGVLDGLFGQNRGQVFSNPADQSGAIAVGVVDTVTAPTAALAGRVAEERRPALTVQVFQGDILPSIQAAARASVRTETFPDRARAALGVPPEEAPAEGGEGAPAAQ